MDFTISKQIKLIKNVLLILKADYVSSGMYALQNFENLSIFRNKSTKKQD